jgi:DNA-binding IclR family transcriptional regulator
MTDEEVLSVFTAIRRLEDENERLATRVADLEGFIRENIVKVRKAGISSSYSEWLARNATNATPVPDSDGDIWFTLSDEEMEELGLNKGEN